MTASHLPFTKLAAAWRANYPIAEGDDYSYRVDAGAHQACADALEAALAKARERVDLELEQMGHGYAASWVLRDIIGPTARLIPGSDW